MPRPNDKRSILPLSGKRDTSEAHDHPGGAFASQQVPAGIEQLLGMAAADAAFGTALLERRQAAIEASGVALSPAEQVVLAATPETALRQMLARVKQRLPENERRSFLGLTATALLALAGGGLTAMGCARKDARAQADAATRADAATKVTVEPRTVSMRPPAPPPTTVPRLTDLQPRRTARPAISLTGILPRRQGPTLKLGAGKVSGGLDQTTVRRIIRRHLSELRYCYVTQHLAKGHQAADGKLLVRFTITTKGKVKQARVTDNSTGDKVLTRCVEQAVARWLFPKPAHAKPAEVSWRFNLTAGSKGLKRP